MDSRNIAFDYNHASHLTEQLKCQFERQEFCDITIFHGNKYILAHGGVLCALSPYFETMFRGPFNENRKHSVDLTNVFSSFMSLKSALAYFYTGKIDITKDNIQDILHGSTLMLLSELENQCEQYLLQNISRENCIHTWHLSELYDLTHLKTVCRELIQSRFYDWYWNSNAVAGLQPSSFQHLLEMKCFRFLAQSQILDLLNRWIQIDPTERVACLQYFSRAVDSVDSDLLECFKKVISAFKNKRHMYSVGYQLKDEQNEKEDVFANVTSSTQGLQSEHFLLAFDDSRKELALYGFSNCWRVMTIADGIAGRPVGFVYPYLVFSNNDKTSILNTHNGEVRKCRVHSNNNLHLDSTVTESSFFCISETIYAVLRLHVTRRRTMQSFSHQNARYFIFKYDEKNNEWINLTMQGIRQHSDDNVAMERSCKIVGSTVFGNKGYILLQNGHIGANLQSRRQQYIYMIFDPETNEWKTTSSFDTSSNLSSSILLLGNAELVSRQMSSAESYSGNNRGQANLEIEADDQPNQPNAVFYNIDTDAWKLDKLPNPGFVRNKDASRTTTQQAKMASCVGATEIYLQRDVQWANKLWTFLPKDKSIGEIASPPLKDVSSVRVFSVDRTGLDDLMRNGNIYTQPCDIPLT